MLKLILKSFLFNFIRLIKWPLLAEKLKFARALLSRRAQIALSIKNEPLDYISSHFDNPFSLENPKGIVNLSTADNSLCREIVEEKWKRINFGSFDPGHLFRYPVNGGLPETKQTAAKFIDRFFGTDTCIDPKNLVILPGVSSAFDAIGCSICNENDGILTPAPYYLAIYNDFKERSGAEVIPVPISDRSARNDGKNLVKAFESCYYDAQKKGKTIKAILITNPNNPTGEIFPKEHVFQLAKWAIRKNLYVLVNEIYALSTFDEERDREFCSILRYSCALDQPDRLIWTWGMSKDFCIPGHRFALLYTTNKQLLEYLARIELFQPTTALSQFIAAEFLKDHDWYASFQKINQKRLKEARSFAQEQLKNLGVQSRTSRAGFFIFCNFCNFLDDATFESERDLDRALRKAGVLLLSGESMKNQQPGWFRLVFTGRRDELNEGAVSPLTSIDLWDGAQ